MDKVAEADSLSQPAAFYLSESCPSGFYVQRGIFIKQLKQQGGNGMKYLKVFMLTLTVSLFVMAFSAVSYATEEIGNELKKGEALFNKYGCVKCHAKGKGLAKVASKEEFKQPGALEKVINQCLQGPSKSEALDPASEEMKQLKAIVIHISEHATPEGAATTHEGSEHKHEGSEHKHEGAEPQKEPY
ncbi:MAG TPA: cytochrome c [Thermodesulfovibrionia bacterium]|nr:cytochrome c [Thermodesulfovibrionia bacterium]